VADAEVQDQRDQPGLPNVVYYESIKRELKIRCIYECRCDERLQTKTKEFTHLTHTGFRAFPLDSLVVYLQQIKKKAKAEGKTCHAKTILSLEKPIKLL
jgi:hypothetical protein